MTIHGDLGLAAEARALARAGRWNEAEATIAKLIAASFDLWVAQVEINRDRYSLNSLNGFVTIDSGESFFFKFHQEEGEGETVGEYYRGEVLRDAGFPVDAPLFVSRAVGRQILLYRRRGEPRLADLCRAIELGQVAPPAAWLIAAQRNLDRLIGERYLASLHQATSEEIAAEPIHQLFHARLVDAEASGGPGGRARRFYVGQQFAFPGLDIGWPALAAARWRINGVSYGATLAGLFEESRERLAPGVLGSSGAVVAHGDAHNANVWAEAGNPPKLVFFDPAFAGPHVPALLAEIKATFHNILAHPLWLYDAPIADQRFHAEVKMDGDWIDVRHDWQPSPLRLAFLDAKTELVWRPLLQALQRRGWLPAAWRRILRCALFCCPTLVMDLRAGGAGGHTPTTSAIGLAVALMVGSEPNSDADPVSRFFASIDPAAKPADGDPA